MSWTDERVDLLSRLWMEGRSASQIAAQLGAGLTRNAVIGKVHRLGLAGRVKSVASANVASAVSSEAVSDVRETVEARVAMGGSRRASAPRPSVPMPPPAPATPRTVGATSLTLTSSPAPMSRAGASADENVVPLSLRVSIVELRENMCKWPLGDPSSSEFRYCGSPAHGATPYCTHHGKIAYQPAQDRRRERERERRPLLAR
jgi:GcrA cell cycle regulator